MKKNEKNLFREIFPYSSVPYVSFENETVEMNMPEDIWITCTTFRDGQQARAPYTVKQIVDIFTFLHELGGPKGVIKACEFFLYSSKDREAVRQCQEKGFEYPVVTGWIRATKKDFKLVKRMGLGETGILTSASDYHIYLKLKIDRKRAMEKYLEVVDTALEDGIIPRCHLEDITRADFDGFVIPFVRKLMERSKESGIPVKIRACDTLGYGVPHPQAPLPRSVPKIIDTLVRKCGVPSENLEWHGHNDFHKVLINGLYAWLYGASAVNGTLLGFGERTGNPPIEALVIDYISLKKTDDGMNTGIITEIAEYYRREFGENIPQGYPFVGSSFNTTRAGIHADGLIKNEEIYNIFDTKSILNRPMKVAITDKSGTAGISLWVNNFLKLKDNEQIDKNAQAVTEIYQVIMEKYDNGRITSMSDEEMEHLTKEYFSQYFESELEKLKKKSGRLALNILDELSETNEIRSMNPEKQEKIMDNVRQKHDFIQFMYVVDRKGVKITRNIINPKYSKDFETKDVGVVYSDRKWFSWPIEKGIPFVSNFYTSRITGRLLMTVSAPIRNKKGEVVGVVGIDMTFEDLVKI